MRQLCKIRSQYEQTARVWATFKGATLYIIFIRISKLLQIQTVSQNTVPVQLYQELNSSKSHTGLRKVMYYLKNKIRIAPFCFSGPDIIPGIHSIVNTIKERKVVHLCNVLSLVTGLTNVYQNCRSTFRLCLQP
jgi:hypothetical protein